ncbi:hypothetical protein BD309DRAFT_950482 [Dichomitus squalens]|uniref:Uncharacterized protein n=2 Tax=Dichomitus squalens TaxID=114155 RepID=A0A4Q9N1C4_9APHY|nr:uncharacterized protein DICSQDRAFT_138524 [Dichomitus squalens LYAD-421 SS1]EJF59594.1 hypothetical protein DICSQDRAFT_138524 [Dichomitus squalens LYAD-421 SS1]TBU32486.1 hypothetical protein BD311DRAFT_750118 [Dichomitus squalens]TBU48052.1 hypothetical protein BD309DRAFT_950482 [Dichomitus squalens]
MLSNDLAALIGFACESALWGANAILFVVSIILLRRRGKRTNLSLPVVAAHCALFSGCTVHFALEFNHFYTTLRTIGVDGYANETHALVGADIFISLCDLIGDYILIYWCWMMWGRNYWVVILPSLTAIAGFACIMEVVHLVVTTDPTSPVPPTDLVPLTLAGYSLPLCTNVMATGLISFRIWSKSRRTSSPHRTPKSERTFEHNGLAVIVESGLLYLIAQLTYVVLIAIPHPAEGIIAVMAVQIYGIAPALIIIRVLLGAAAKPAYETSAIPMALASAQVTKDTTKTLRGDGESSEVDVSELTSNAADAV